MILESNKYYTITDESMERERQRLYEKARHDEARALKHARNEGRLEGKKENSIEIARKLMRMGLPFDQITEATGLPQKDIESL